MPTTAFDDLSTLMAPSADGARHALYSPTVMPNAGEFYVVDASVQML
ncbi:hypothetical protein [Xanthomonas fragariae]|nr:hypothetical protein [Xanthomonas fragariae]UKR52518.1 hypothetical protein K4A87_18690 [Xanthomonas fragariae]